MSKYLFCALQASGGGWEQVDTGVARSAVAAIPGSQEVVSVDVGGPVLELVQARGARMIGGTVGATLSCFPFTVSCILWAGLYACLLAFHAFAVLVPIRTVRKEPRRALMIGSRVCVSALRETAVVFWGYV